MFNNKNIFENSNITQYICVFYKDFKRYCEEKLKPYTLTNGLYYYLIFIYKKPGSKLNEISKSLNLDKAQTTRAIQKLIDYGYVRKEVNEHDKKSFNVYPTEIGRDIMNKIINLFSEWEEEKLIKNFSKEERELLQVLVQKAFKNI
ncbi:MarR family transcriptional regulator [Clostridium botulinum]|uniref:MarR family transcriptional regulator n=1 Tax=Clostridium botulinum TaxID=1491 RepID=A0A6M0SKJ0_CLOBO|nr:MarR family transcriptional regulator [Clostridium botulinum]